MGKIEAICLSEKKGTEKHPVAVGEFCVDWGLKGDAHAGHWHRQVSLLAKEEIEEFRRQGAKVAYGAFGENLVTSGLALRQLAVGTHLRAGDVLLEVTQIGKECHSHCAIFKAVGDCIMPRAGIFARVLAGGTLRAGSNIEVVPRPEKFPYQAAVITLSDKGSKGLRKDQSGPVLSARLTKAGYQVVEELLLPDGREALQKELCRLADQRQVDLILTTGGTGFGPHDVTPEATLAVAERLVPGISEAMRAASLQITPYAMLSRGVSVIRKKTLIINLPGSPKACKENIEVFLKALPHGLDLLRGQIADGVHQ